MPLGDVHAGAASSSDQRAAAAAEILLAGGVSDWQAGFGFPPTLENLAGQLALRVDANAHLIHGKCNYVLFFPRRKTAEDSEFRVSLVAGILGYTNWRDTVPGREYARKVFRRCGNLSLVTEDEIDELFEEEMTVYEYHVQARKLIISILSMDLKLACAAEPSHHADEVILTVSIRPDPAELRRVAAQMRYQLPLSDKAYAQAETKLVRSADGQEIRGHSAFIQRFSDYFEPFRPVDGERMLKTRVDHHINMVALEEQGVLLHYFLPHSQAAVHQLTERWANVGFWYYLPSHKIDVHLKDYFGEDMAWMYVWQTHFTQCLTLPAGLGALVFWRRFSSLDLMTQRIIQLVYAAFIIVWAAYFNASWDRLQARLATAWGMTTPSRHVFEYSNTPTQFRGDLGNSVFNRVFFIKLLCDFLILIVVGCSVYGTLRIQNWRNDLTHTDRMLKTAAAMLLSVQIMIIDFTWLRVSKIIVARYMNYRTEEQCHAGWVQRVFWPRLFNNLFPFVYIGFFKPRWYPESCPHTQAGCFEELEMNLIVYFMARVFVQVGSDVMLMMVSKLQIWLEFKTLSRQGQQTQRAGGHTYVQIQSKAFPYDKQMHLEAWMDFTMTFVFVACFSVVLPAISFLAMLVSLVEVRLVAHRNLHYLRRPDPDTSEGIGIWRDILEWVEILAVLMNLGIAIFVMRPIRDYPWSTRWILFVVLEHLFLLIREVFKSKFANVPLEVDLANEENQKTLMALLSPEEERVTSARPWGTSPRQQTSPRHSADGSARGAETRSVGDAPTRVRQESRRTVPEEPLLDIGPEAFPDATGGDPLARDHLQNAARRLMAIRSQRAQQLRSVVQRIQASATNNPG